MTPAETSTPDARRAAHAALPTTASLRGAAQAAAARGEPLVVMTTLAGCPYCDVVRNHHLLPMLRAGQVVAIQIDVRDRTSNLQGFAGDTTTPAEQARLWKARFAPTVMFFGPDGREVAERLVGVAVPDFYGEYLQARLVEARQKLR
jgi:thioredoxin-related protein